MPTDWLGEAVYNTSSFTPFKGAYMHYFWALPGTDTDALFTKAVQMQSILADYTTHFYAYPNLSTDPDPSDTSSASIPCSCLDAAGASLGITDAHTFRQNACAIYHLSPAAHAATGCDHCRLDTCTAHLTTRFNSANGLKHCSRTATAVVLHIGCCSNDN